MTRMIVEEKKLWGGDKYLSDKAEEVVQVKLPCRLSSWGHQNTRATLNTKRVRIWWNNQREPLPNRNYWFGNNNHRSYGKMVDGDYQVSAWRSGSKCGNRSKGEVVASCSWIVLCVERESRYRRSSSSGISRSWEREKECEVRCCDGLKEKKYSCVRSVLLCRIFLRAKLHRGIVLTSKLLGLGTSEDDKGKMNCGLK